MNPKEIRSILEPYLTIHQINEAIDVLKTLPIVEVKYTLGPINPGQECELQISLKRLSKVFFFD